MLKRLAVMQPWATLIVHGFKSCETRSWITQHRGPLLIQASRRFGLSQRNLATQDPFASCLASIGLQKPLGLAARQDRRHGRCLDRVEPWPPNLERCCKSM
jgi:hypothetical protein